MSQINFTQTPAGQSVQDRLVVGLDQHQRHDDAVEPPDPTLPPWGTSLVREYRLILEQWDGLGRQDRPGIPPERRTWLEAEKLKTFERAAVVRAQAVNELLTILRWAGNDTPGQLSLLLREIVIEIFRPEIEDVVSAVMVLEERINRRGVAA